MQFSEDIEADLARYYPRDEDQLTEFWAGRMTWRRLWVLVSRLPSDSSTNTERVGGPEVASWTTLVELMAQTVDAIRMLDFHYRSANSKTHVQPPPSTPRPREIDHGKDTRAHPPGYRQGQSRP